MRQGDVTAELLLELLELLAQDDGHDLGVLGAHPDRGQGNRHLRSRLRRGRHCERQRDRERGDTDLNAVAVENRLVHDPRAPDRSEFAPGWPKLSRSDSWRVESRPASIGPCLGAVLDFEVTRSFFAVCTWRPS